MDDLDALHPLRAPLPWVREEGLVVVLLPKRLGLLSGAMQRLLRGPLHLRVPLDEVGSRAFELADGTRTLRSLAAQLEQEFGDRAGPADRAAAFVGTLARNGLVLLAAAPGAVPEVAPAQVRLLGCGRCGQGFHVAEAPGTRLRCPACGGKVEA